MSTMSKPKKPRGFREISPSGQQGNPPVNQPMPAPPAITFKTNSDAHNARQRKKNA